MSEEIWKEIKDIDGYFVSSLGRVKSIKRKQEKILKPKIDKDGYHEYGLYCNVIRKVIYRRGHRLVAQAFISNQDNLPIINHKNLKKDDNRVENLEWCTCAYNTIHGYANQPDKRNGKGLCDLTKEEFERAIYLYLNKGYFYSDLNEYFGLDTDQTLWGDVFMGNRFSEVTGITESIRDNRNPSYTKTDEEVFEILERYFLLKNSQTKICKDLNLNASYVSRIVNRKKRIDIFDKFMEKNIV